MVAVALLGGILAAVRFYPALVAALGGVSCLTLLRTFEVIDNSDASGWGRGKLGILWTLFTSILVALVIIAASAAPGFCFLLFMQPALPDLLIRGADVPITFDPGAVAVAALMAIPVASFVRRRIW